LYSIYDFKTLAVASNDRTIRERLGKDVEGNGSGYKIPLCIVLIEAPDPSGTLVILYQTIRHYITKTTLKMNLINIQEVRSGREGRLGVKHDGSALPVSLRSLHEPLCCRLQQPM
jgi:hypothetical protein